ncbi:cbb3-type cytochrome c oxidase subunit I [Aquibacillus saliphilus]|uniref:cbb3-type cytochrome c oxidase subunit I n=1 Tax=Aquibacillus saliphilus TaxID=1909422 RepID=UPI001CEFC841|nr:cbb3-type cytochrome c oxidase subunit I [Aquibacillus saliphilus]
MLTSPGLSKKTETNIKLPLSFILFGLGAFVLSQFIFFIHSDALTNGIFRLPELLMGAHFLLLGWIVMVIMGAMYQLVPVAFLTPIWSEKLGFIQLFITGFGIIIFSLLLGMNLNLAVYGAIFVIVGILLFLFQMLMTLRSQQQKNIMTLFVSTALVCFLITIVLGFILAWTIAFGATLNYTATLQSHILLGVAGWFTLLIFGFSYKMVPMFSLSHGFLMKWAKLAFIFYTLGLLGLILSFWFKLSILLPISWVILWFGFTFFALDIKEIIMKRMKRKLDRPFTFSLLAIGFGWIIHSLAAILSIFSINNQGLWSWLIFLYIICWIMFSILGYLYKIVPFLWWTYKYSSKVGKSNVPLLKDLINEKLGTVIFVLFTIGIIGLSISGLLNASYGVQLFQGLMLTTSILYGLSIVNVLRK